VQTAYYYFIIAKGWYSMNRKTADKHNYETNVIIDILGLLFWYVMHSNPGLSTKDKLKVSSNIENKPANTKKVPHSPVRLRMLIMTT